MKTLKFNLKLKGLIFILTFIFLPGSSFSQNNADNTDVYHITTTDNNEYTGIILLQDSSSTILKTSQFDSLILKTQFIKKIEKVETSQLKEGKVWMPNPQSARYFWAPNGYGLKKGEAYYQNVWVLFNQISVGVTDNFSIGFGMMPTFLFGADAVPVWLTPKFSVPVIKDKFNIGAGAMYINVLGAGESAGLVYGLSTFGSKDKNLTIGLGYGFTGNDWAKMPTINVSGLIRTGPRGYLITENYIISTSDGYIGLAMVGGRTLIKRITLDYGLAIPFESGLDRLIAVPWLGITVPFGRK
jgi:hypothetical protein